MYEEKAELTKEEGNSHNNCQTVLPIRQRCRTIIKHPPPNSHDPAQPKEENGVRCVSLDAEDSKQSKWVHNLETQLQKARKSVATLPLIKIDAAIIEYINGDHHEDEGDSGSPAPDGEEEIDWEAEIDRVRGPAAGSSEHVDSVEDCVEDDEEDWDSQIESVLRTSEKELASIVGLLRYIFL